jgi:acetyltransferase-like isoleucine patch superfamily enzyme
MIARLRLIAAEGLLYITNRVIARIPSHTIRRCWYRRVMRIGIGRKSSILMDAWFDVRGGVTIGSHSTINQRCRLDGRGGIRIGDNVAISAEVTVLTADHDLHDPMAAARLRPVLIEDYVFIGTGAMVLPGVTLGRGSAVAARAVVSRDVPPYAIVAGMPARVIGQRPGTLKYSASYSRLFA